MDAHNIAFRALDGDYSIPDTGNGKNLSVDRQDGIIELTIAAGVSETRTLPAPRRVGIRVAILVKTLGASGTCAVAGSFYDTAARTSAAFNAEMDQLHLISVRSATTGLVWQILNNVSVTMS